MKFGIGAPLAEARTIVADNMGSGEVAKSGHLSRIGTPRISVEHSTSVHVASTSGVHNLCAGNIRRDASKRLSAL